MRTDKRANDELRPVAVERNFTKYAEGSVLVSMGDTKVLCTATVDDRVPRFLKDTGRGWVTAEYSMLPRCAQERIPRSAAQKGRALEISRLIGRSLRCAIDLAALGECQIVVDCDVLQADGGTRCASITGAYVALRDAVDVLMERRYLRESPLLGQCVAVSVGVVKGEMLLDLCYEEDFAADVDMNLVMRSDGRLVEVQGAGEEAAFSREEMNGLMDLAEKGIRELFAVQHEALGRE